MLNFDFHAPTKILFGKGKVEEIADEIKKHGSRVLITYGGGSVKKTGLYDTIVRILKGNDIFFKELPGIQPNPRITSVRRGVELCRRHQLDFLLAVGGGSVIDGTKAIAAGVPYEADPWDFPARKAAVSNPLPLGTILTLAATGSEMNGIAVISNDDTQEKLPMGSDDLRPKFSVLDPEITFTVNRWQTGAGTADIFTHVMEQYFTKVDTASVQDRMAEAICKVCIQYGAIALEEPENYEARANLMWASTLALNGLLTTGKQIGDWATHTIEHELSAYYDVTHGAGLAVILPYWMEYVLEESNVQRFVTYAENVWGIYGGLPMDMAKSAIAITREFFSSLGMPTRLTELDIDNKKLPLMAKKAVQFGPIGRFKELQEDDVLNILKMAL